VLHIDAPVGLRLRIADANQAPQVARELKFSLNGNYLVRDWTQRNATWFAAVQKPEAHDVHYPDADCGGGRL
jgi:lipoprotein-releasing system permease protein